MSQQTHSVLARNLYLEGRTHAEIARTLGVSENTVSAWKKRSQWPARTVPSPRAGQMDTAFALFRQGVTQKEIAHRVGVSENTVTDWKQQENWLARRALLQDKMLDESLAQVVKVVLAHVTQFTAAGQSRQGATLWRACAYVCQQLERPDLVLPAST